MRTFESMIKEFTLIALKYEEADIIGLFNRYLTLLSEKEVILIGEKFPIFIRSAEVAREASPEMKEFITKM